MLKNFNHSGKFIKNRFLKYCCQKNHHIENSNAQNQFKSSCTKHIMVKRDNIKRDKFPENPAALKFFSKGPPKRHHFGVTLFLRPNHLKANGHSIQNTLIFYQNLFNSRSNMHLNLVFWLSLHPKKGLFLQLFQDKHNIFEV